MNKSDLKQHKQQFTQLLKQAEKAGCQSAKLGFQIGESMSISFEAGRLKETGSRQSCGYSISVMKDGKIGEVAGNRLDQLDTMLEQAVTLAKIGRPAHFAEWPAQCNCQSVPMHCESVSQLNRDRMIEDCQGIVASIKAYNDDLYICSNAGKSVSDSLLMTSSGLVHTMRKSAWNLSGFAQRTGDNDMVFSGDGRGWGAVNDFYDPASIGDTVIEHLRYSESRAQAPQGQVTAMLDPHILYCLLYPVFMGINGKNVYKGDSPLKDKLGERILDSCFNITDAPHTAFSTAAREVDSDGVPTRQQTLIEDGMVKQFLYDLDTAGLAGATPTGNNGCSPYYPVVKPGSESRRALLESIDDGIYVKNLIGFGQGNLINGDFSCNVGLGYRIENGKIAGRIKDVMISGNIYELLKEKVVLSSDTNYNGSVPYAVIEGLNVSSK